MSRARRFFPSLSLSSSSSSPSSLVPMPMSMSMPMSMPMPLSISTSILISSSTSLNSSLDASTDHFLPMQKDRHLCQRQNQSQRRCRRQQQCLLRQQECRRMIERRVSFSSSSRLFSSKSEGKGKYVTFSSRSSAPSSSSSPSTASSSSSTASTTSPMTMGVLWKESTARLLNHETTPIGSMSSLQWHLAETLVLYWSTSHGTQPPSSHNQHRHSHHHGLSKPKDKGGHPETAEEDWFKATKEGNWLSLQILDRLAEEKIAASNLDASNNEDEDFRTIDVSLIHAVLKQWKDCLHWANNSINNNNSYAKKNNDYRNNQNSRYPHQHRQNNNEPYQNKSNAPDDSPWPISTTTTTPEILLPSELLQKLDTWAPPTAAAAADNDNDNDDDDDDNDIATKAEKPHSSSASTPASLFEPNIATYTILMDGAVSCRNFRERVVFTDDLLNRLLRESRSGSSSSCSSLEDDDDDTSRLRPTVVTIGTVIHALANSRTKESAEKAETWLRKMPNLYGNSDDDVDGDNDSNFVKMRPNTVIYTTVIRAWADVGRADRAEGLLREMCRDYVVGGRGERGSNPDAKPSLWTFNTVLAAWSRSKNPSSVIRAEGLIRSMKSLSSPRKSEETETTQRDGKNDKEKEESSSVFGNSMEDVFNTDGAGDDDGGGAIDRNYVLKLDVSPTIVSYNSLMGTIASRSKQPDALAKAEYWMEEIIANAAAAAVTTSVGNKPAPLPRNGHRHGNGRRSKMGRKNDDSMAPNLITLRALFNIIASANNLSNTEKADRMRYWLARGSSPSLSPKNYSPDNDQKRNNHPSNSNNNLMENTFLLEQIHSMEQ